jgi:hypothetical protein
MSKEFSGFYPKIVMTEDRRNPASTGLKKQLPKLKKKANQSDWLFAETPQRKSRLGTRRTRLF